MERKRQPVRRVVRGSIEPVQTIEQHELLCGIFQFRAPQCCSRGGTSVSISTEVTLTGGPNDIWIFQIAGTLNQANGKRVTLAVGAQVKNIFWQVADSVTIGTTAHPEGVVLGKTLNAITQPAL